MQLERAALQVGGPLGGARVREMPRGARQRGGAAPRAAGEGRATGGGALRGVPGSGGA